MSVHHSFPNAVLITSRDEENWNFRSPVKRQTVNAGVHPRFESALLLYHGELPQDGTRAADADGLT